MKEIRINNEYLEKYEEGFEFDKSEYDTDKEIEVRIPFEGYYSLKVKVKDPQVAMAEVLKANDTIGIMSCVGGGFEIEEIIPEETYAIVKEDEYD